MDRLPDDELLSAYLDDELSADERAYVEQLLAERLEARRLLDELRGVRESLQALPSYKLEPDFGAQVLQRAEREVLRGPPVVPVRPQTESADGSPHDGPSHDGRRWRRPLLWSIVAVAAAVVLMFVDRTPERERHLAQNAPQPGASSAAPAIAAVPAAPPPTVAKAKDGGFYSVMNALPGPPAGAAGQAGPPGQVAEPTRDLDRAAAGAVMLKGGTLAGAAPPTDNLSAVQSRAGQVDVTPLVAENDYWRAQSLVADYNDVRRTVTDDRAAARAFAGRVQLQLTEERQQARQPTSGESPLIVSCVVASPDAVERGLAPVLRQQQIADLTSVRDAQQLAYFGAVPDARQNAAAEIAKTRKTVAPAGEQYVYVVAERGQLQATLAEMRRRPELFTEVSVEPAATTISSPVPAAAVAGLGALPSAPASSSVAASPALPPPAPKSAPAADEQAGADKKQTELRVDRAPQSAVPSPSAGPPASQYAYVPEQLAPLSRSQRIVAFEAEGLAAARETDENRRAGEKDLLKQANAPIVATAAAPAAPQPSNRPAPAAKAEAKDAATANESLDRLREAAGGAQRQLDEPSRPAQQLRGAYAAELPPDYQEALFIFRVAAAPAEKSQASTPAAESTPAPAVKPQATGKAD